MMTVKEIAEITGISARTLHYYDEIGLLKPTAKSEAGYRLYDDKALETLQQILFFREFDIPLKEIKSIITSPDYDRNQILQMQRKMLVAKKERMERLIASLDDILKGENKMDFSVFNEKEIEEMFQTMFDHMPENIREISMNEFGTFANNPISKETAECFNKRIDTVLRKLLARREYPLDSFEIKEAVAEYGFIMKMLYQIKDEKPVMLSVAESYRDMRVREKIDADYGEGASNFFANAIKQFYQYDNGTQK